MPIVHEVSIIVTPKRARSLRDINTPSFCCGVLESLLCLRASPFGEMPTVLYLRTSPERKGSRPADGKALGSHLNLRSHFVLSLRLDHVAEVRRHRVIAKPASRSLHGQARPTPPHQAGSACGIEGV